MLGSPMNESGFSAKEAAFIRFISLSKGISLDPRESMLVSDLRPEDRVLLKVSYLCWLQTDSRLEGKVRRYRAGR
jgi:hypothetical protein